MRRVAVVGSGISGLAAAYELSSDARVTLFEAGGYFGGHTNTIDLRIDGVTHGVDTGFLVFNHRTYPNLLRLFAELGVETAPSDMSFSVQAREHDLEWSGSDLNTVFAQRRNLLRPRFLKMLSEIVRFNRLATAIAEAAAEGALAEPIGEFLDRHAFGNDFRDWYFLPMIGCIWSCPTDQMLRFPVATMIRFCHNHGLIQVNDRPQWHTVKGGARNYVEKMLPRIADARVSSPVFEIRRDAGGVAVTSTAGTERFDEIVLACHSDQALALLADASDDEREVLGAIRYQPNRAVVHGDASVLPKRKLAWASWNYVRSPDRGREQAAVCLHYLLNRLQPLPWTTPVIVSLNPETEPAPATVFREIEYAHPVFDLGAIEAQRRIPALQGRGRTWFCGAWTRYGFHEDGLSSALDVVRALRARWHAGSPALQEAA